jgi:hypothetical protein
MRRGWPCTRSPPCWADESLGGLLEIVSFREAVVDADVAVLVTRVAGDEVGRAWVFTKLAGEWFVYSSANVMGLDLSRVSPKGRNQEVFRLGIPPADEVRVRTEERVPLCRERFGRVRRLPIWRTAEPAPQRDDDPKPFLWIGRLVPSTRSLAFGGLARSLPDSRFWIVADVHAIRS